MANTAVQPPVISPVSILTLVTAPFRYLGRMMIVMAEANSRQHEVQRLMALSDEQLAKRGLKRDEIVRYVFRSTLFV
ncbi:MAG: hypothetical protein MK160_02685 [Rhodobacteraceae bacterium]|nr:hypothetical protein [Paracoccaceae bacterium]